MARTLSRDEAIKAAENAAPADNPSPRWEPTDRMVSALVDVLTEHGCGPVSDETAKAAIRAAMEAAADD